MNLGQKRYVDYDASNLEQFNDYFVLGKHYWNIISGNVFMYLGELVEKKICEKKLFYPNEAKLTFSRSLQTFDTGIKSIVELRRNFVDKKDKEKIETPSRQDKHVSREHGDFRIEQVCFDEYEYDLENRKEHLPYKVIYNREKETVVLFFGKSFLRNEDLILKAKREKDDKFSFDILLGFYIVFYKYIFNYLRCDYNKNIDIMYEVYGAKSKLFTAFESVFINDMLGNNFNLYDIKKLQNAIKSLVSDKPKNKVLIKGVEIELVVV